jgi:hypothetical protein
MARRDQRPDYPGISPKYPETLHYTERNHAQDVRKFRVVQSFQLRRPHQGRMRGKPDMWPGSGRGTDTLLNGIGT